MVAGRFTKLRLSTDEVVDFAITSLKSQTAALVGQPKTA